MPLKRGGQSEFVFLSNRKANEYFYKTGNANRNTENGY